MAYDDARVNGRDLEAMRQYELAVSAARKHGFLHHEALANQLAPRFYETRGFDRIARNYLRDAHRSYQRWEANGKVRQLEYRYPYLWENEGSPHPTTIATPVEQLDLAAVIKVSQAVSGETVRERLIDILMRTALEYAGADRGVLTLIGSIEQRIEAQITATGAPSGVNVQELDADETALPASVLQYAERTRENVIIADTSVHNPFSGDPYLLQKRAFAAMRPADQPGQPDRRALPREQPEPGCVHVDPHRDSEAARLASCDLAGKYPSLSQSRRT